MASRIGTLFSLTTFGESHGAAVGAVVDGCPPRMALSEADIQPQLTRRRPGQSRLSTPRDESDEVSILSGVENGLTVGSPIAMLVRNRDQRPADYDSLRNVPRPSHADFSYKAKYGILPSSGGGRSSARETIGRVAGGVVAEKFLREQHGVEVVAWVSAVGGVTAPDPDVAGLGRDDVDAHTVRCPDTATARGMAASQP